MKQKICSTVLLKAGWVLFMALVAAITLMLSSFRAQKMTDDVWKMLGVTKQDGSEKIKNSFMYGYLYYYGVKNVKNLATNDRAAIAKDLLTYTKDYISSAAFKKQYDDMRSSSKPVEPVLKPLRTIEQIQKEEIAKTEKSINDAEKNMKDMPQYAKSIEPVLDVLKKNLKEYQNPKHQLFSAIAQGEKYQQENEVNNYQQRMKQWESSYPVSVNDFIATKLQKMLDATKDIDYNAELVEKWGKKRFVNPAYESKNQEWKQGFRAGKEVTDMSRSFARKWLNELQIKK